VYTSMLLQLQQCIHQHYYSYSSVYINTITR